MPNPTPRTGEVTVGSCLICGSPVYSRDPLIHGCGGLLRDTCTCAVVGMTPAKREEFLGVPPLDHT